MAHATVPLYRFAHQASSARLLASHVVYYAIKAHLSFKEILGKLSLLQAIRAVEPYVMSGMTLHFAEIPFSLDFGRNCGSFFSNIRMSHG